jgi:hypothetical protein
MLRNELHRCNACAMFALTSWRLPRRMFLGTRRQCRGNRRGYPRSDFRFRRARR